MKRMEKIIYIIIVLIGIASISTISNAANISSSEYKIEEGEANYIIGIYPNTRVEEVKGEIKTEEKISIYDNKGKAKEEEEIVATGDKIYVEGETYIAIVCGDVNKDGDAGLTDLVKIKNHIIGKEKLEGEEEVASDVDASGVTTGTDIINLKRLIVRIIEEREIFEREYKNTEYEYKKNKLTGRITITKIAEGIEKQILQIPNKIDGNEVKEIKGFLGENNKIEKVTIPTGVEEISSTAFSGMKKLEQIEVSGLNEEYRSKEGILYNKEGDKLISYPRGKEGEEYTIGEEIKIIGEYAFYKNDKIEKLYIADTVEEIESKAFEEMKGKIYVKEGGEIIGKLKAEGIKYEIDAKPEIKKLISEEGTNQVITIKVEATDDVGIVGWSIGLKGGTITWNNIEMTKRLETSYQDIKVNGTYEVRIKDNVGNIEIKEIIINGIDSGIPRISSIKIISPTSGEYKAGQRIIIRVQFSEKIKGIAPTLKLRIGEKVVTAKGNNPAGTQDYIDYNYEVTDQESGEIEIESYTGGNITDIAGNTASIIKLANTGNKVIIKKKYDAKYGPYTYAVKGTVINSYKDDSIEVSVEKISGMYVCKIWIADPSKQIKKIDNYAEIGDNLQQIPNAIIGSNGGYFSSPTSYTGSAIITEGRIISTSNEHNTQIMGIYRNGKLVYKEIRDKTAQEMINMGIVNTFGSWPGALIENGNYNSAWVNVDNSKTEHRTALGQVNDNNYIIIVNCDNKLSYKNLAQMGESLNCQFLFNLDGGGSTQLWMRNQYIKRSYSYRKVANALYFTTLE